MSSDPEQQVDAQTLEATRKQINRIVEEIARLSESALNPPEFFQEFMQRVLNAIAAPAGAYWARTAQGHLQLQYQINMQEVGFEAAENGRAMHDELLRQTVKQGRPVMIPPHASAGEAANGAPPGNPTGFVVLIAPVMIERQVTGLIEVWQDPNRSPAAQRGFLQFLTNMGEYVSTYLKNTHLRQMIGQQQIWVQLETYTRQIHNSLNPREVSYLVANEARRLLECDRVSVAIRLGSWTKVEAISGSDVVEKRSSLVQTMRALFDAVVNWGERLVYTGSKDEGLPPKVLEALDQYLAESNSKLLVIVPMRDEREKDSKRPCRSAMMAEMFEPNINAEQLVSRMEVVTRHAGPAMYNALEHKRIPFRWLLLPLANLKDSLRGRRLAIAGVVLGSIALVIASMILIPWELRMDAKGQLLPKERIVVYSRIKGPIKAVYVKHGDTVARGQPLLLVADQELLLEKNKLNAKVQANIRSISMLRDQIQQLGESPEANRLRGEVLSKEQELKQAQDDLQTIEREIGSGLVRSPISGIVTTFDIEKRKDQPVEPKDPLMQIARLDGPWEVELKIPENKVGPIREALARNNRQPLEVDIRLSSVPNRSFRGLLYRDGLAGEVGMENNEPVLTARVELGDDLKALLDEQLRKGVNMSVGVEVNAKIRCGKRAIGYVWFYELWEFIYERVIF